MDYLIAAAAFLLETVKGSGDSTFTITHEGQKPSKGVDCGTIAVVPGFTAGWYVVKVTTAQDITPDNNVCVYWHCTL